MTRLSFIRTVFLASILICAAPAKAEPLAGTAGDDEGTGWQSSWLDLNAPMSFKKNEWLLIKVEGNAENVLIRLLPKESTSNSSDGIEGSARRVPDSKILAIKLERDHPNVKQISVHAGKEAWGNPLGSNNGVVKIVSIEHRK